MKRIVLLFFTLIVVGDTVAQSYYIDEFKLSSYQDRSFGIYTDLDAFSKQQSIYIDMDVPDNDQMAQMKVGFASIASLIRELQQLYSIYNNYELIVNNNKPAKLIQKTLPIYLADKTMYFTSEGKWYVERGDNIKALFFTDLNEKCFLMLQTDNMSSEETVGYATGFSLAGMNMSLTGPRSVNIGWSKSAVEKKSTCTKASWIFSSPNEIAILIDKLTKVKSIIDESQTTLKLLK